MAKITKVVVGTAGAKGVVKSLDNVAEAAKKRVKKAEKSLKVGPGKVSIDID